jgi:hypothetical protein
VFEAITCPRTTAAAWAHRAARARLGDLRVILQRPVHAAVFVHLRLIVDADMGVRAQDRADELVAKPRAHGERRDQRRDGQRDAEES